jgi:Ca2+/H+ antiporter
MNNLLVTFLVLTGKMAPAKRREAGQGSLEYVGMIAVAALIVAAVAFVANAAGPQIGAFITAAIAKVQSAVGGGG